MEFNQELILALIGLLGAAALTISVVIKKNQKVDKRVTKTKINQKGDNPQAYINSTVDNSKKVEK
ncbi:hypothetical protein BACERE00193_04084 [Bacillus paranthracis]|uniref:hypothetical protein n=1 Tax=Bacillus cereus group TaxID=86661 RepID=UPI000A3030D6|nr:MULTISPECIES: hypothetical protein [Bacillus cereus group]MCR6791559.1 hypothetical protein [Bacillus paranthracis]MED1166217.1 hypothetical protein [Bacillus paranthracis]NWK70666.1 hypothetical protein [Bacillus paramycoides]SME26505.1 hypothetical protein BACERE00193_04084 [Bacillus paranthracis]